MTLGDYRVGITFNPSGDQLVSKIKRMAADLIDLCYEQKISVPNNADGEITRLWAEAMTCVETAAMYAVKAATKKPL